MKRLSVLLGALALIGAFFIGALTGLERVFLDPARYIALQDQLNVYEDAGVSREEQALIDQDLAGYLRGDIDSLERRVTLLGEPVDCAFNARELEHMKDVRRLFEIGFAVRRALIALTALLLIAAALTGGRAGLSAAVSAGLIALMAASGALTIKLVGFSRVFIAFHHLAFSNDLWLLDPATDAMIRMLPEEFFAGMALQGTVSAALFALLFFALAAAALAVLGKIRRARR
ncbi:MAG: TIGR01906 family membrane protein [Clostridiales bacterium]|nr:TIGR01906 family membrane protein [Clostridiales bacterium]MDD7367302.1 TIGR01906 family membrane protein [Clostridiales bacterium]MDY2871754.1 TIGR01906 family membrane protein [Eubacteriales bacterium]